MVLKEVLLVGGEIPVMFLPVLAICCRVLQAESSVQFSLQTVIQLVRILSVVLGWKVTRG